MVSLELLFAKGDKEPTTSGLMEKIADPLNIQKAYNRVRRNGGCAGVDEMKIGDLKVWLRNNLGKLEEELLSNSYKPEAVKGVKIRKPAGGYRQLGIPTVIDRLVQQSILQLLTPIYESIFSQHSFGFRPGRSAHDALRQSGEYVKSGNSYVVDLDLEQFFDKVNHHRLEMLLKRQIKDERVLILIRKYLRAGMLEGGLESQRIQGTPQGGPLSPLLSNIVLDELDKELEYRGHKFVRYADDVKIFVGSQRAAERVKESVINYIERKLLLKVNREKSRICRGYELNFLGHRILRDGSLGLSDKSESRLKERVRSITKRKRGVSPGIILKELKSYLGGWLRYFRYARMQSKLVQIESWIKRKLRCFRLKQCKRCIGMVRLLRSLKVEEKLCWKTGLSGKGWWRLSNSPAVNIGMNNSWFANQGFYSLVENYKSLNRVNL